MKTWPAFVLVTVSAFLWTGCAASPMEAYTTNKFMEPPVILNADGQYSFYVWERTFESTTINQVTVVPAGDNLQVFVSEMITQATVRNGPKVIPLTIPPAFQGKDLTHRFVYLNPDNTTDPMQVVTTPPASPLPK